MAVFQKKLGPIGIDVSDSSVEVAQVRSGLGGPTFIHGYGRMPLPPGTVKQGRLLKPQDFTLAVRKLLSEPQYGRIDGKQAVLSIPEHQCYHYVFVLDAIGDTRLPYNAVRDHLISTLPHDINDVLWDWMPVRHAGSKTYMYVLAVPKDVIAGFQQALSSVGIAVRVVEAQILSAARGIWSKPFVDEPLLHMDIGSYETAISTIDDIGVHQSSVVDAGLLTMAADLVKELKLSQTTAQKILFTIGLRNLKHPQVEKIHAVIRAHLQNVFEEAKQHLAYYHAQEHLQRAEVSRLSLIGGGAVVPGVPELLSQSLKLHFESNPVSDAYRPALSWHDFALHANALGASRRAIGEKDPEINVLLTRRDHGAANGQWFSSLWRKLRRRNAKT